ncbi:probable LRR receptor-like serine/threonine-protein kinase isoform X1 [Tanacetum coccineum]
MLMMFKPNSRLFLLLSAFLLSGVTSIRAQVRKLPPSEGKFSFSMSFMVKITVLKEIAKQLSKKDWDFDLNPCDTNWTTPRTGRPPQFNNSVVCDCSSGDICHVTAISVKGQDLTGVLPKSLAQLPNIKHIDLSYNYLNGTIPREWASTKLEFLAVTGNRLSGSIPNFLGSISTLGYLSLENNMFSGIVPAELGKLKKLATLVLNANNLTGELPEELNGLTSLIELRLSSNNFRGKIPNINITNLQKLEIQGSGLEGPIPVTIFRLRHLIELRIKYYSVHINCGGPGVKIGHTFYEADQDSAGAAHFIPTSDHWGLSNTGSLWDANDTSNEYIATNVSVLAVNHTELYTTARHSPLSLTYYGRCLANGNYTVTLHFAEIVFRDNKSYQGLGRRGAIKFKNYDIENEAGGVDMEKVERIINVTVTNKTLEIRLQYAGKGSTAVPQRGLYGPLISAISIESYPKPYGRKKIYISVASVAAALCLILIVLVIAWQRGYIGDRLSRENDLRGLDLKTGVFTYRQITAATDNFSASNKLGEGGFGSVYKGTLLDGTLVAVKELSSTSTQGNREFVNEIGMIAGIQHPNVVRLHGCCVEGNHLLLVYEYMENNSLAHALFVRPLFHRAVNHTVLYQAGPRMEINWATRKKICIGIAKGLTFLHEESVLKMVHRDIKATNVLLDSDLTPKISDFGLAKLHEEDNTHFITKIAGTMGYMAPEYALWGHLTYKADVYSFGVLALEIVAGKNNMRYRPSEDYYCLLDFVKLAVVMKQKGSLIDLVDPRLGSDFNKKEAVIMMTIGLLCTNQSPALRPTMSQVVNMLEGRTKIMEPNMITSKYDAKLGVQELGENSEKMHSNDSGETESLLKASSSSSHNLFSSTQISEES